ncbi:hypothetical protein DITRI_Ditri07aG0133800 [Diplodiscus trichospermus]
MGRRKVQLKRIEDKSSKLVTFSKKKNGLMKKVEELVVLCDVELLLSFSGLCFALGSLIFGDLARYYFSWFRSSLGCLLGVCFFFS